MTISLGDALERLLSGYWNALSKTDSNPGGFGNNGHTDNLPAVAEAIGVVGNHVAGVAGEVVLNGVGVRLIYTFDDDTADADPGANTMRANSATDDEVTELYLSTTSGNGDVTGALALFGASTNPVKGQVMVAARANAAAWALYNVSSKVDGVDYRKIVVSHLAGGAVSPFATDNAELVIGFSMAGNQGNEGPPGGGLASVEADGTPQLGGDLDVAGYAIVSVEVGDIELTPDGTGRTRIKNATALGVVEGEYVDLGEVSGAINISAVAYTSFEMTGDTTVAVAVPSGTTVIAGRVEVIQGTSGGWTPTFTDFTVLGAEPDWTEQAEGHRTFGGLEITPTGAQSIWFYREIAP